MCPATFKVRYVQEIELGDGKGFRPADDHIEAVFSKRAASNGLLAQMQKRAAGSAGMVLITLSLHTRPLIGEEFRLLRDHGLVDADDEGRLFCWLTRQGIAEVLDTKWDTVDRALKWLIAHDVVRAVSMPPDFVARFVQNRGQFASDVIYMLNTHGLLRNQWVDIPTQPSTVTLADHPPATTTIPAEEGRCAAVPVEGIRSPSPLNGDTVSVQGGQSILNTTTAAEARDAAEAHGTLETAIAATWASYMAVPLPALPLTQLTHLVMAKETSLALITALLRTVRQEMGALDPEVFVGILTGAITNLPWEGPTATNVSPVATAECSPEKLPSDATAAPDDCAVGPVPLSEDPVLAQVARWYEQEIGQTLTPMSTAEIRDLTGRYRNLDAWQQAFTKAAATPPGMPRWRYIIACMEDTNGQFSLERRTPPPRDRRGRTRSPDTGARPRARRAKTAHTRPPVEQYSPDRQAHINAAATIDPEELERARSIAAEMGIDLDAKLHGDGQDQS